jgi:hypothetical protein
LGVALALATNACLHPTPETAGARPPSSYAASPRQRGGVGTFVRPGTGKILLIDDISPEGSEPFEITSGVHKLQVVASTVDVGLFLNTLYKSKPVDVCLKATRGHTYSLRASVEKERMRIYFIDKATDEPSGQCAPGDGHQ